MNRIAMKEPGGGDFTVSADQVSRVSRGPQPFTSLVTWSGPHGDHETVVLGGVSEVEDLLMPWRKQPEPPAPNRQERRTR